MRNIEPIDVRVILMCSTCFATIKAYSVDKVLEIAYKEKWIVDDEENALCPTCATEDMYRKMKEDRDEKQHQDNLTQAMSQEVAG